MICGMGGAEVVIRGRRNSAWSDPGCGDSTGHAAAPAEKGIEEGEMNLTRGERETFLRTSDEGGDWELFTLSPTWSGRLQRLGYRPEKDRQGGWSCRLPRNKVTIRNAKERPKRALTPEQAARAARGPAGWPELPFSPGKLTREKQRSPTSLTGCMGTHHWLRGAGKLTGNRQIHAALRTAKKPRRMPAIEPGASAWGSPGWLAGVFD